MRGGEPWPADFDVRIERLEQHYREVHEAEIRSKERALLEQVAYALAGLVESFVFAAAPTGEWLPLTLTQISKKATAKQLTSDQKDRWQSVQTLVTPTMLAVDRYLRKGLTVELDHWAYIELHETDVQRTTINDLLAWAERLCSSKALQPVKDTVQLLSRFSSGDCPLQPDRPWTHVL